MKETTDIPVSEATREQLKRAKNPGESFDDVLQRLLTEESP